MTNFEIVDEIQRSLEKEGLFQSVRAQLRASVFRIISDGPDNVPKPNKVSEFAKSTEGRASLMLVRDLLEKLNLTQSLSIFQAEAGLESAAFQDDLEDLNLPNSDSSRNRPLLEQLILTHNNGDNNRRGGHNSNSNSPESKSTPSVKADAKTTGQSAINSKRNDLNRYNERDDEEDEEDYEHVEKPLSSYQSDAKEVKPIVTKSDSKVGSFPSMSTTHRDHKPSMNVVDTSFDDDEEVHMSSGFEAEEHDDDREEAITPTTAELNKRDLLKKENFPLNTRSYDFNEVVDDEDEEVLSEIDEEVPEEEEEDQLSVDDSRDGSEKDAKQLSSNSDKKVSVSAGSGSSHHTAGSKDSKASSLPPVVTKSALPPLQSGRPASHNISMDISSSFEAEASTNSMQKTITAPVISSASQNKEAVHSESKQDDKYDHKHDDESNKLHNESELSERSVSMDEVEEGDGPEVDSSHSEAEESAGAKKFRDAVSYADTGSASTYTASTKRVDIRSRQAASRGEEVKSPHSDDNNSDSDRGAVSSSTQGNKANVQRMGQGAVSRSRTGWDNVSNEDRGDFESDEDDHPHRSNINNNKQVKEESLRDISDDNIEEQDFRSESHSALNSNHSSRQQSLSPPRSNARSSAAGGAWGAPQHSPVPGSNRNRGPGSPARNFGSPARNSAPATPQREAHLLESSFEEEKEDREERADLHTSYRSNNQEEEDEEVIEHDDSYESQSEEESNEYSHSRGGQKEKEKDVPKAFTTRDGGLLPAASSRQQDTPSPTHHNKEEEEEEEYAADDYGDDFEEDDADNSRLSVHNRDKHTAPGSKPQSQSLFSSSNNNTNHNNRKDDSYEEEEEIEEESIAEEDSQNGDDMSVGENSDNSGGYTMSSKQNTTKASDGSGGMAKSRSGLLSGLPSIATKVAEKDESHNPNSYFNNDSDEEDDEEQSPARKMNEVEARLAAMEKEDSTLRHLKRNLQDESLLGEPSELISESGSVASEDLDVMEFSNGHHSDSDGDGF